MKIKVTFDVDGPVNDWHFASYLTEVLDIPQEDKDIYNIKGIDNVEVQDESV